MTAKLPIGWLGNNQNLIIKQNSCSISYIRNNSYGNTVNNNKKKKKEKKTQQQINRLTEQVMTLLVVLIVRMLTATAMTNT